MLKKLKSKLKSKSGLTLTEMLITVILLMFFSSACLLGISTALSTRREMIKAADSDILCSTVTQYISNELRLSLYGDDSVTGVFSYKGGSSYAGLTYDKSKIKLDSNGRLIRSFIINGVDNNYPVFNDSAYSCFTLSDLTFEIIDGTGEKKIKCSFVIKDGDNPIKTTEFTVTPLTPIE